MLPGMSPAVGWGPWGLSGAGLHQLWGYGSVPSGRSSFHQRQGWHQLRHSSAVGLVAPCSPKGATFINCVFSFYGRPHRNQFAFHRRYACKANLSGIARILDNRSLGHCHLGCHQDAIRLTPRARLFFCKRRHERSAASKPPLAQTTARSSRRRAAPKAHPATQKALTGRSAMPGGSSRRVVTRSAPASRRTARATSR